jgi:cell volume regulation protein A
VPITLGVPGTERLFDLVFLLVVVFTLVQAPALPWMARHLGVADVVDTRDVDVESAPLGELDADVLQVRIGAESRMHGLEVFELRLPTGANVTLVARDGTSFVPGPRTVLRHGDQLLVIVPTTARARTESRLHAVSVGGRLAVWGGGPAAAHRRSLLRFPLFRPR